MSWGGANLVRALSVLDAACELRLPDRSMIAFGTQPAGFRLILHDDRLLRRRTTQFDLARAYVEGKLDLESDDPMAVFALRDVLSDRLSVCQAARLAGELVFRAPTGANAEAIRRHYSLPDSFYLTFLDSRYHFYSHCLFRSDDETLEQAAEHKLESMWSALGLCSGMRLLDVGAGWGGVTAYCGSRGVGVTSLTLTRGSAAFIDHRISDAGLLGEVIVEDVLNHRPGEPYDHAVILGVVEHVPTYAVLCERLWNALKPGGRVYIDASATKEKYAGSRFTRHYTWHGPHSCLALQDLIAELLFHGFEIVRVRRETHDYELTMREWARRFDRAHAEVAARWGEDVYRAFRVFLWGGAHAFKTDRLQAYSLVAERRPDPGPRPGRLRRWRQFLLAQR